MSVFASSALVSVISVVHLNEVIICGTAKYDCCILYAALASSKARFVSGVWIGK